MGRKSIIKVIIWTLSTAMLILIVSFSVMISFFKNQEKAHQEFVSKVSVANDIIVGIEKCSSYLNQFRHDWDERYYNRYLNEISIVNELASRYMNDSSGFSESNVQAVRRFSNFLLYEGILVDTSADKSELYEKTSFILTGLREHESEIHMVLQSDLQLGYGEYFAEEEHTATKMIYLLVGFSVACVFLVVLFVFYERNFLKQLRTINNNLNRISSHDWDVEDLSLETYSEFVGLSSEINETKRKLHEYFLKLEHQNEIERSLADQKIRNEQQKTMLIAAQMETLKAQVNPHFLFNSLHQIGMAALVEEPDVISELVEATGKILRYSLYNKDSLVSLSEELDVVQTYVGLQRKYTDRTFSFSLEVEPDTEETLIIPMCIQPLVENAFKHGFAYTYSRTWELSIRCWFEDDVLWVCIRDNGTGSKSTPSGRNSGIGLSNIARRLELKYGRNDLMKIEQDAGQYMVVTLGFPLTEDADESIGG